MFNNVHVSFRQQSLALAEYAESGSRRDSRSSIPLHSPPPSFRMSRRPWERHGSRYYPASLQPYLFTRQSFGFDDRRFDTSRRRDLFYDLPGSGFRQREQLPSRGFGRSSRTDLFYDPPGSGFTQRERFGPGELGFTARHPSSNRMDFYDPLYPGSGFHQQLYPRGQPSTRRDPPSRRMDLLYDPVLPESGFQQRGQLDLHGRTTPARDPLSRRRGPFEARNPDSFSRTMGGQTGRGLISEPAVSIYNYVSPEDGMRYDKFSVVPQYDPSKGTAPMGDIGTKNDISPSVPVKKMSLNFDGQHGGSSKTLQGHVTGLDTMGAGNIPPHHENIALGGTFDPRQRTIDGHRYPDPLTGYQTHHLFAGPWNPPPRSLDPRAPSPPAHMGHSGTDGILRRDLGPVGLKEIPPQGQVSPSIPEFDPFAMRMMQRGANSPSFAPRSVDAASANSGANQDSTSESVKTPNTGIVTATSNEPANTPANVF